MILVEVRPRDRIRITSLPEQSQCGLDPSNGNERCSRGPRHAGTVCMAGEVSDKNEHED